MSLEHTLADLTVKLSISGNSIESLSMLASKLLGVSGLADKLISNLARVRMAALGVGAGVAAIKIDKMLFHAAEAGGQLNDELIRMRVNLNLNDSQMQSMSETAHKIYMMGQGYDEASALKMVRESASRLYNPEHPETLKEAQDLAEILAPMMQNVRWQTGMGDIAETTLALSRVFEARGIMGDTAKMQAEAADWMRAVNASGTLTARDYANFVQQAGPAARMMSPREFYGQSEAMMVAMGPFKAGTAAMSIMQQYLGGVMTKKTLAANIAAGIIDPDQVTEVGTGAHRSYQIKNLNAIPGLVTTDANGERHIDLISFLLNTVGPKIRAMKGDDQIAEIQAIFGIAGRQTAQRFISEVLGNPKAMRSAGARFDHSMGPDQANDQISNSISKNLENLAGAWHGLMQRLGVSDVGPVVVILKLLTTGITALDQTLKDHPAIGSSLFAIGAGLSSLFSVLAPVLIGMALIGGKALAPLRALRSGIGWLASAMYRLPLAILNGFARATSALASVLLKFPAMTVLDGIVSFFSRLLGPISAIIAMMIPTANMASPEQERSPYGGKSLHERFPGLVLKPDSGDDPYRHMPMLPPPTHSQKQGMILNQIYMDKRLVAQVVTEVQAKSRPNNGTTNQDLKMTPLMPGFASGLA